VVAADAGAVTHNGVSAMGLVAGGAKRVVDGSGGRGCGDNDDSAAMVTAATEVAAADGAAVVGSPTGGGVTSMRWVWSIAADAPAAGDRAAREEENNECAQPRGQ